MVQTWRGVSVLVRLLLSTFNFICSHLILTRVFFLVTRLQGNNMDQGKCNSLKADPWGQWHVQRGTSHQDAPRCDGPCSRCPTLRRRRCVRYYDHKGLHWCGEHSSCCNSEEAEPVGVEFPNSGNFDHSFDTIASTKPYTKINHG